MTLKASAAGRRPQLQLPSLYMTKFAGVKTRRHKVPPDWPEDAPNPSIVASVPPIASNCSWISLRRAKLVSLGS